MTDLQFQIEYFMLYCTSRNLARKTVASYEQTLNWNDDCGIDRAIINKFGQQLMDRVQEHIIEYYAGEHPIGTSFIIYSDIVDNKKNPYLAHTPTMKVPMKIVGTDNVYYAMKAMLLAVKEFNLHNLYLYKIETIACSGFGTFIGGMSADSAVRQMRLAYDHVNDKPISIDWMFARDRYEEIEECYLMGSGSSCT